MTELYDGIYRGLRRFRPPAIIACIVGALSIGIVYGLTRGYGLMGALLAQDVFYALLLIALAAGYRGFEGRIDRRLAAELVRYAVLVGVANVGYYLYTRADIIILKHFGYVVEIGYYEIINRLFNVFIVPSVILAQVLAPRITALAARDDFAEIRRRLARYAGVVLAIFAAGAMVSYPIFTYAIKRFLPEYAEPLMFQSLFLLMFLVPAKSWGAFLSQGFAVPAGQAHVLTITTLAGGLLNVMFDIVFIHYLGYIGAIWSTLVIHSATIAITHWYFLRLLQRRIAGGDSHAVA
jgi:O-antigen/teichoic acid export membrane protein